jgi:regulator of protease activity HflC (stomatin/prohibitin superfamily)
VTQLKRFNSVGLTMLLLFIAIGLLAAMLTRMPILALPFVLVGLYLFFAIVVVDQWKKVAVLRFGRYLGLRGPGVFLIIPVVDRLSQYVDQRVRVHSVTAESTLTRDTVPVSVDAVFFWLVWNVEKTILEVQD